MNPVDKVERAWCFKVNGKVNPGTVEQERVWYQQMPLDQIGCIIQNVGTGRT